MDVKSKDQPSSSRDAELLFMAQKIKALEEERDFLRQTVKTLSDKRVSREEVCPEDTGPESTDDTPSSSSTSSSSDDGHPRKGMHGKKKKEKLLSREKQLQGQSGPRGNGSICKLVSRSWLLIIRRFQYISCAIIHCSEKVPPPLVIVEHIEKNI